MFWCEYKVKSPRHGSKKCFNFLTGMYGMIIKYYSYDIAFRIFSMKYFQKINKVICCMFIAYKRNSLPVRRSIAANRDTVPRRLYS